MVDDYGVSEGRQSSAAMAFPTSGVLADDASTLELQVEKA